ncbi:MAG TPA: hypothetical protein VJ917_01955 [Saprospiraceae bacterium]|nr:hypothetical protein [Saprospiraceae bacterium]
MDFRDLQYLGQHAIQRWHYQPKPPTGPSYYLLHIPKTAGTSLRYDLYDAFPAGAVYPDAWEYYIHNKARYLTRLEINEKKFKRLFIENDVIIGHFGLKPWHFRMEEKPKTFAFFRHPVDRIWSSIRYHSKKGRRYYGKTMMEILEEYGNTEGQMMARMLGYEKKRGNLQECFENLEQLKAIGLTDAYEESLDKINDAFGWQLKSRHKRNSGRLAATIGNDWKMAIMDISELDLKIYEKAQQLFECQ